MTGRRSKLSNAIGVPTLAFALSVLLVIGQALNCCRINETISASIGQVLKTLVHGGPHAASEATGSPRKSHPGCHGHGPEAGTESPSPQIPSDGPHYQSGEPCLSELSIASKALVPAPTSDIGLSIPVASYIPLSAPPRIAHLEKPRPQNKSSPPVYLLTLRILV